MQDIPRSGSLVHHPHGDAGVEAELPFKLSSRLGEKGSLLQQLYSAFLRKCSRRVNRKVHFSVLVTGLSDVSVGIAYVKEIDPGLHSLQAEVGGDIATAYPFSDPVGLVCNDEGKLIGLELNRGLRDEHGEIYDVIVFQKI